ncbi:MAG: hypothetical protein O7C75_03470 [Verrucomicrobia bacterium]|nr:hypothetical protein [Verrucomicrobiota bacterium]
MDPQLPEPDSFRKLVHDLNQLIFLMRGHCELAKIKDMDSSNLGQHLQRMEAYLDDLTGLAESLKEKQLDIAPNE